MKISNILILPADNALGAEMIRALRYEKTALLFASDMTAEDKRVQNAIHLPEIAAPNFITSLEALIEQHAISHIIPTTDEARALF